MAKRTRRPAEARDDMLDALGELSYAWRVILALGGEFLLLNMLDDLVFHAQEPFTAGWAAWIALVVAVAVLTCRFIWRANHGKTSWSWQRTEAGRARVLRARILFALALGATLLACYGVRYAGRQAELAQEQSKAAQTVGSIKAAFEGAGLYTFGADPAEGHERDGYAVNGRLESEGDRNTGARVVVDNAGVVTEVSYHLDVDPAYSLEENLERAERNLTLLHEVVAALDVPFERPGLASFATLPEPFCEAFLSGSVYEEIIMHPEELGHADGATVSCAFWTSSEEDWSDILGAYIDLCLELD